MVSDFNLLDAVRAVFASDLGSLEKLVALALLNHWSKNRETFPSVDRLARWTSLSRRSVIRALASLETKGAIAVARSQGRANRYELGSLMSVTSAPQAPVPIGHQCPSDTPPVPIGHPTSAPQAPEVIHGRDPSKRSNSAPRSRTRKTPVEKQPEGTSELRDFYVAEFQRTRNAKPEFGKAWGRAMKSFGQLIAEHGLDDSKLITTRALEQQSTPTFTPKVNPWDVAVNANNYKGAIRPTARVGRIGVQNDSTVEELADHAARIRAAKGAS